MPVLGLQKGENFVNEVVPTFSWRSPPPRVVLARQRLSAKVHSRNSSFLDRQMTSKRYFKRNVVIAAYGTQATLHKHPTRSTSCPRNDSAKANSAQCKSRTAILTSDRSMPVRRLSLTLNVASKSLDAEDFLHGTCYDRITTVHAERPHSSLPTASRKNDVPSRYQRKNTCYPAAVDDMGVHIAPYLDGKKLIRTRPKNTHNATNPKTISSRERVPKDDVI